MKNIITLIIVVLIGVSGMAQPINQTNSQGKKIGKWTKNFDNGNLRYKGQFENGYEVGEFVYYYSNGKIQSKMRFSEKGVVASVSIYYKNGAKQATGSYWKKQKHSTWKYYNNATGNISKEETYYRGKKSGPFRVYYSNEQVYSEIFWKEGVRHGSWKEYFENGELKLSATFVKGKMEGEYTTYYLGKKVSRKGQYVNGKLDGVWMSYNEQGIYTKYQKYNAGILELERKYENGKMVYELDNIKNTVIDLREKKEGEEGEEK